jgi:hypothetical protein
MGFKNFNDRYCEMRGVKPGSFAKTIIRETCYPQARSYYIVLLKMGDARTEAERVLVYDLAEAESVHQLESMINGVYFASYLKSLGTFRKKLKLRLSGSRIVMVAREVFASQ